MKHLNSKNVALTAIFAALYYVMSYLPGIPAIGVPGVKIQLEACMASVFGIILGPCLGALAALLGVSVAWALPPGGMSPQGLLFLPSPVINALISGLIYNGRWKTASIMLAVLVAAFWLLPPTQPLEENFIVGVAAMWDKILALLLIVPAAILTQRLKTPIEVGASTLSERSGGASHREVNWIQILALISAILILVNAHMIAANRDVLRFQYSFQGETYKITLGYRSIVRPMAPYGYLWYLIGAGILAGAIMLIVKPEKSLLWGAIITILSGTSTIIGGGFIVGFILGVISGLLSVSKVWIAKLQIPKMLSANFLMYFLIAFIGNEADNAWGNNIFAVPQVYEGLYGMSLQSVRLAFLVSPYAYFIIRLIQGVIAALITLPLINNLKAAGLGWLQKD